jgi:hypothetical protein
MGKYNTCGDARLLTLYGVLTIVKCILEKRHDCKHTDGKVEW